MTPNLRTWLFNHATLPLVLTIVGGLIAAGFAAQDAADWQYRQLVMNWRAIPLPIKVEIRDAMAGGRMRRWDFTAIERDMFDAPIAVLLNDPKGKVTDPRGDLVRLVNEFNHGAVAGHLVAVMADDPRGVTVVRGNDGCKYIGHVEGERFAVIERRSCHDPAGDIVSDVHMGVVIPASQPSAFEAPAAVTLFPDSGASATAR